MLTRFLIVSTFDNDHQANMVGNDRDPVPIFRLNQKDGSKNLVKRRGWRGEESMW